MKASQSAQQHSRAGTKAITVHFPEEVRRQLKAMAGGQGRDVSDLIAEGLNLLFARYNRLEIAPRKKYYWYSLLIYLDRRYRRREDLHSNGIRLARHRYASRSLAPGDRRDSHRREDLNREAHTPEGGRRTAASAERPKKAPSRFPLWAKLGGGLMLLPLIVGAGTYYYLSTRDIESTDDAYTDGRVTISSKVTGYCRECAPVTCSPVWTLASSSRRATKPGET
jgi:hypothetical protein